MTFARLIRSAVTAWDRWRWKRQAKSRAPLAIVKMQDELQAARRKHKKRAHIIQKMQDERHAQMGLRRAR